MSEKDKRISSEFDFENIFNIPSNDDVEFSGFFDSLSKSENIETDDFLKSSDREAVYKHNKYYNKFLREYVNNYKRKNKSQIRMKWVFFVSIMLIMLGIIATSLTCLISIAQTNRFNPYNLTATLSSLASSITAFIILPKIIANHLFPEKEDDKTDSIFGAMISYDKSLREFYSKTTDLEDRENK